MIILHSLAQQGTMSQRQDSNEEGAGQQHSKARKNRSPSTQENAFTISVFIFQILAL